MSKINFGVAVVNSFDLLDDENADEQPKVTSKTSAKEDKGISRGKQAEPKKEITSPSQKGGKQDTNTKVQNKENQNNQKGQQVQTTAPKQPRKFLVGEGPEPTSKPVEEVEDKNTKEGFRQVEGPRSSERRGRGRDVRGRPRNEEGGERGERGERGSQNAPQGERNFRRFDRHSGTGRGKEISKGGAGKANWGVQTENETYDQAANPEKEEEQEEVTPPPPKEPKELTPQEKEEKEKEEERRKEEEKESRAKLLSDYLEEKQKKALALPSLPPPRKPNEDAKDSYQDYKMLERTQEPKLAQKGEKEKEKKKESKSEKISEDLLGFTAPRMESQRGDRDRGRGRGGRGGYKGDRQPRKPQQARPNERAIKVDDEKQFPSLTEAKA